MRSQRVLFTIGLGFAAVLMLAGCSHAVFPNSGGGGGSSTSPVILTIHDTPASEITIVSFEVTITGASLTSTGGTPVSLLSTPQTLELTQLQANSAFLSSTSVNSGSYSGLTVTFANPQFTFVNNTGQTVTAGGVNCASGKACVVTPKISGASTMTFSSAPFPLQVAQSQQNLLEVDLNLNNIVQSDYSANFGATGAGVVTNTQANVSGTPSTIGTLALSGAVSSVGSNSFQFAASTGQNLTVAVNSSTIYNFSQTCSANDFTCVTKGEIVNVALNILTDGTFQASAIGFDDASGTQQFTGEIVALNGTPPASLTMVLHSDVPSFSGAQVGTPVTVTIGGAATFNVGNIFTIPNGVLPFGSASDLLVGQEIEARLSGTFSAGSPASFTTDRIMLEPTKVTVTVTSVSPQTNMFVINQLPALFIDAQTNAFTQIQVFAGSSYGTIFQNLATNDLTSLQVGHHAAVAGFLFDTIGTTGSPTMVATVVRDDGP